MRRGMIRMGRGLATRSIRLGMRCKRNGWRGGRVRRWVHFVVSIVIRRASHVSFCTKGSMLLWKSHKNHVMTENEDMQTGKSDKKGCALFGRSACIHMATASESFTRHATSGAGMASRGKAIACLEWKCITPRLDCSKSVRILGLNCQFSKVISLFT